MAFFLRRTQRDFIREHNELDTIEDQTEPKTVPGDDQKKTPKEEKEKSKYFLPKCFLLVIGLLILLAGMIALIYFYKDDSKPGTSRGHLYSTPPPEEECPDIYVFLGNDIVINCTMFDNIQGKVAAVHANLVGATTSDFDCEKNKTSENQVICTAKQKAKCSSYGRVEVLFYESSNDDIVNFTRVVDVKVPEINPVANISQIKSEFELECSHRGDCNSYEVSFSGSNKRLTDSLACTTTYSDEKGYVVDCSAVVPSERIFKLGNGSTLYCELMHGDIVKKRTEFELPLCTDIAPNENCSANTTIFDCKDLQDVTEDCNKSCDVARQCFSTRVDIVQDDTCPERCVLHWCRDEETREIDISTAISFNHICKSMSQS